MDRKKLEERLAKLKAERDQLTATLKDLPGRIQAYHGAIQDCEYWLKEITKEDAKHDAGEDASEDAAAGEEVGEANDAAG